jgi:hypothetical protein
MPCMSISLEHLRTGQGRRPTVLLLTACLLLLLTVDASAKVPPPPSAAARATTATTRSHGPVAESARTLARALGAAHWNVRQAERVLARRTRSLQRCLRAHPRRPGRCRSTRRGAHAAAGRLAHAKRLLSEVSALAARARRAATQASAGQAGSPSSTGSHTSAASTAQGGATFEMGAVVGSAQLYELPWLEALGARTARMEFPIDTPVSVLAPVVEGYAKAGIRPLLLASFQARIPSEAETQNLANWAVAFGSGGTFWKGKSLPANTAVSEIEFGNETNNPYQFSETSETWYEQPSFIQRAEEYARRLKSAQIAIAQSGANVGLLGIADQYGGHTSWVQAMFRAVPDLGQRVAGWTVHPYGQSWRTPIDNLIAGTQAHGAPSGLPIYVTEWGLSTDNGRCLSDNFGWNPCMTYEEAASTLAANVSAMRARYGNRLRAFYLFQARDQQPSGASSNREFYFGALQSNRAAKGAYTAEVQSLLAANP